MGKKDKDHVLDEFGKVKSEMLFEKVSEIIRNHPGDYIAKLKEIGFEYHEEEDDEELEERTAVPENRLQRDLVAFFQGEMELSDSTVETFLAVRYADCPNLPLIRKYFRMANKRLKSLLLYGLDRYPARMDLLSDLAYYHEFENILGILITHYTRACLNEMNLETFTELARDFYYATHPDGYEALYALRDLFEPHTEKRKIIDSLIAEEEESEKLSGPIKF